MPDKPLGFLDDVRKEDQSARACPFNDWLGDQHVDLVAEVEEAMATTKFPTAQVLRALEKRGLHVNRTRLQRCRNNCDCGGSNRKLVDES